MAHGVEPRRVSWRGEKAYPTKRGEIAGFWEIISGMETIPSDSGAMAVPTDPGALWTMILTSSKAQYAMSHARLGLHVETRIGNTSVDCEERDRQDDQVAAQRDAPKLVTLASFSCCGSRIDVGGAPKGTNRDPTTSDH